MDKKFLNKVVDQLVNETRISKRRAITLILTPFCQRTFSASDFSQGKDLHSKYSDVNVLHNFLSLHCKDVYSLDDTEISYVFQKYRNIVMLKINGIIESYNKKYINEAHITNIPEEDYINKVVNMLDNPPYLYELESMGLSEEEVKEVFKKMYGDGVRVKYRKGKEIRVFKDGWQKGLIIYLENGDYEDGNFQSSTYWEKWEWYNDGEWRRYTDINGDRRLRSENGLIIYDDHIKDCCPEELEDGFYPPLPTSINENKMNRGMDIPLLTKVAQQLMSETSFEVSEFFGRYHLFLSSPMYTHEVQFRDILSKSPSYNGSVSEHIRNVYGLKWEEVNYVWLKYIDLIHQKIKKEKLPIGIQSINESRDNYSWLKDHLHKWFGEYLSQGSWYYQYILDDKFLSKVLQQLLSESKIDWDEFEVGRINLTVGWDPHNENALGVDYNKFAKHCREIYSLNNIEVSDMWILYTMAMKKRLGIED